MIPSPEERVDGICAALARAEAAFDKRGWVEMPKADRDRYVQRAMLAKPLIDAAIREAESAALEDAAASASGAALRALGAGYDREQTVVEIVVAIRALKHKD